MKDNKTVAKQYNLTYDSYNNWKLPLNLAVGFHLLVALSIAFLPGLLKSKPKYEDIYTVNLINLSEPAEQAPPAPPTPAQQVVKPQPPPEPVKSEKAVAIAEPAKPAPAPPVPKAVSLKPLNRKVKKTVQPPPEQDLSRQRERERLNRERLAEVIRTEQQAAEEARLAAEEAERQQRLLEQQLAEIRNQVKTPSTATATSQTSRSSSSMLSAMEKQYYASIINRVSQFWALPEFRQWDPSLQAVVVITVSQDGSIINQFFEQKSGDATFDQFVGKTLQDANPLPDIPPALRKTTFEIGLRFRPGSIQ